MEIASFEPVVGNVYNIQDMTVVHQGTFLGFAEYVYEADVHGTKVFPPYGEPLLLFETIQHANGFPGHRYAGVRVRTFYDTHFKKVRFTLEASHWGRTIEALRRAGSSSQQRFWKLVK